MFQLNQLTDIEVYEYYDQPVLYSGTAYHNRFLVVMTAEAEWLIASFSEYHQHMLHQGYVDFYECFRCALHAYTFSFTNDYKIKVTYYRGHQLPDNLLPEKGEYL